MRDRESARAAPSAAERELAERFSAAYSDDDVDGVIALLTATLFTMPPPRLRPRTGGYRPAS